MIRKANPLDRTPLDPSPEEIRQRAQAIRETWTPREKARRATFKRMTWTPPVFGESELGIFLTNDFESR